MHMLELLVWFTSYISFPKEPYKIIRSRHKPINDNEDWILDKQLGTNYPGMTIEELDFILKALNGWFVNREIVIAPTDICMRVLNRCSSLLYAPRHFAEAGGDLAMVDSSLDMARRFAPFRDLPMMALFLRDGHVHAGHFTYRDTVLTPRPPHGRSIDIQGVRIFSPRPVPLLDIKTIEVFENIISREDVRELEIQNFLRNYPEVLLTLGYSSARPHICLREPGNNSLIPDFLLELPGGRGFDILDLKLPSARLVARNPYLRMSSELVKALAQLRKYAVFFENSQNRQSFERFYGLSAFRPEIIVVMGREREFLSRDERKEVEEQLGQVRLYTYDDLLAYAQSRIIELP